MPKTPSTIDDDLAQLAGATRRVHGPSCGVAKLLHTIGQDNPDRADRIAALIDSDTVPAINIAETLTKWGHEIGVQSVRRHRNRSTARGCRCPR